MVRACRCSWRCLADEPGFHVGPDMQVRGILRGGARAVTVVAASRMPYIAFIIRQCYGVAGGLHVRHSGMYQRYAWPSAHTGSIADTITGAITISCNGLGQLSRLATSS